MASLTVVSTASDNHFSSSMSPTTYLVLSSTGSSKPDATGTRPVPSAIAPKRSHATDHGLLRTTRKAHMEKGPGPAVARRNERERNRVRQVNQGFATLRQHVPQPGAKAKKMSKVETLRSAVQYIKQLQQLLNDTTGQTHDENSLPSMEEFASYHHSHQYSSRHHHEGSTEAGGFDLTSPSPSSPTPSLGSDASSPYDSLGPEEEELLDFTAWLS